jgi:hypothetical protein
MDITGLAFQIADSPASRPATRPGRGEDDWSAEGTIVLKNSPVDLGFSPAVVTGRLSGKISQTAGKLSIKTDAKLNSLRVKKHSLTRLTGSLVKSPDSDILHIRGLKAEMLGGQIIGSVDIRLTEPFTYTVSSEMKDIDINRLVNLDITKPEERLDVSGKLTGNLAFKVVTGKKPSRLAQGELQISRAKMYKMPVIVDLLTVVYLALPGESAFNRGFVTYHLKDDTMRFSEIYLTGANVSVLGSGTLNIKNDELDLTFLTGPPGKLPRIEDLATEVIRSFSRELVEIRVKGTLRKPKMDTVPLRSLDTILRRLLEPSLKSR